MRGVPELAVPQDYPALLTELKTRIAATQVRAAVSVNRELVLLYWHIGSLLNERVSAAGWGAKLIDQLSRDLRREFPDVKGFSVRNLKYMRAFASAWPEQDFVQGPLAQISWYHHLTLLEKLGTPQERLWYARASLEHGWSRNVLVQQIESRLLERRGAAQTNFRATLPAPTSDLAQQLLKDPYVFDFLTTGQVAHERDLEKGLLAHLKDFLRFWQLNFDEVTPPVRQPENQAA